MHSINLSHPSSAFLTFLIFSLGIATQRPEDPCLLNKIAKTVWGNFLSSREQILGGQVKSGLFTLTIHWERFICTVWWGGGLSFLIRVTYLEVSIQIYADWRFYCLWNTCWIEKEWYSQAISARHAKKQWSCWADEVAKKICQGPSRQ